MTDLPDLTITLNAPHADGWTPVAFITDGLVDARYGTFSITPAMADSWVKNLHAGVVCGEPRVAVDYSHAEDDQSAAGAARAA